MPPLTWALLALMAAAGLSYQLTLGKAVPRRRRLLLKGGTTLLAALLALVAALSGGGAYAWLVFVALLLCALADVLLEMQFQLGMLAFALGHLAYIAAFVTRGGIGWLSGLAYLLLLALLYTVLRRWWPKLPPPKLPFALYGALISLMLALALSQPPLAAIGALFFVVSDFIILYRLAFEPKGRWSDDLLMLLYYSAQALLALSAF